LDISDADMEKGHLRCDANISLRPNPEFFIKKAEEGAIGFDSNKLYPKTEIKNLNSFKSVEKALEYEIKRQTELWEKDDAPTTQSTRGWDEKNNKTVLQRVKEEQSDYRYFPEPDIPPIVFTDNEINKLRLNVGELPYSKRQRFNEEYGLGEYDANILVENKSRSEYFENVITELRSWMITNSELEGTEEEIWNKNKKTLVKSAANWIISRLLNLINNDNKTIKDIKITPENFAELMKLLFDRRLNNQTALAILNIMYETGGDPSDIMESEDLSSLSNDDNLEQIIENAIKNNPKVVEDFKSGKINAIKFLVGQVMKETKGRVDANEVNNILLTKLK